MRLVTVMHFEYPYQAHLAVALLEDAGIPCLLTGEQALGLHPFYSPGLGGVRLRVPEERADEALALLGSAGEEGAAGREEEP